VYDGCEIGSGCKIHAGAVIGADGFGFAPQENCDYQKVPQIGNVIIEDNVEIGANTSIDRATIGSTVLRKGCKLDNLIQIGHNVEIGENTAIAAQVGIAGSTKVGRDCLIGGQAGLIGHLEIADKVKIAAQSGISGSITEEGKIVQGSPAFDIGDYQKSYVVFRKGAELRKQIIDLQKQVKELQKKSGHS
jgi:UDP-3-O-[3-hydroxymyristoyl] glucosamine N-acyltransferase